MFLRKNIAPLRILDPFIKYFLNSFVNIALPLSDSSFNWFSTSTCFVLFGLIYLLKPDSLLSKSVLFAKLVISILLAKFACFNLAANFSDVKLLNSGVVIYLSWLWSIIFFWISLMFVL